MQEPRAGIIDIQPVHSFRRAVALSFGNLGLAFQVCWAWLAVIAVATILVDLLAPGSTAPRHLDMDAGMITVPPGQGRPFAVVLLLNLLQLAAYCSIAVSWHRVLLIGDIPRGRDLLRLDVNVRNYAFGILVMMKAGAVIFSIPLFSFAAVWIFFGFLVGFGESMLNLLFTAVLILGVVPFAFVKSLRFSIALPAIAIGRIDYGPQNAWQDTAAGVSGLSVFAMLVLLAGLVAAPVILLPAWFLALAFGGWNLPGLIFGILLPQSLVFMAMVFALTAITVLYAIVVERRSL